MEMLPKIVIDKSPFYAMSRGYGYLGGQFCTEVRLITLLLLPILKMLL